MSLKKRASDVPPPVPVRGAAAVTVSIVHLARGTPATATPVLRLDGQRAPAINTRLRPVPERADPTVLAANAERYLWISFSRYGWHWLSRPGVIAIGLVIVLLTLGGIRMRRSTRGVVDDGT